MLSLIVVNPRMSVNRNVRFLRSVVGRLPLRVLQGGGGDVGDDAADDRGHVADLAGEELDLVPGVHPVLVLQQVGGDPQLALDHAGERRGDGVHAHPQEQDGEHDGAAEQVDEEDRERT